MDADAAAAAVDAPTDWPPGPLRALDAALRCPICAELFRTPMVVAPCGHTFCSACVRDALSADPQCPACFVRCTGALVPNRALDAAVASFRDARAPLLVAAAPAPDPPPSPPLRRSRKRRRAHNVDPSSDSSPTSDADDAPQCPVCQRAVPLDELNEHVNRCLDQGGPPASRARTHRPVAEADRVPSRVYHMLKRGDLRDLLRGAGLDATGTREELVARHKRWALLISAELDRPESQRRSLAQLRHALRDWERGREQDAALAKSALVDENHAAQHKHHFDALIQDVRNRMKQVASSPQPPSGESGSGGSLVVDATNEMTASPGQPALSGATESPAT